MISTNLFRGELVRLTAEDPETLAKSFNRWARDSIYLRLMDSDPARMHSVKGVKEWIEKQLLADPPKFHFFAIRTLDGDRMIGDVDLFALQNGHREAFVGIGIGERSDWSKGYGTEAMRLALRYAFTELNLHRVSLDVFEYNPRAIRSYEKAGFKHEGRLRDALHRDGRRWDMLYMGILRDEWFAMQEGGL
jgi:RimJ/RimL family protein N-acetyltransferase